MKSKHILRWYILVFVLTIFPALHAQHNDVYSWHGLTLRKDIKKISFYLEEEIRFKNTLTIFSENFTQLGIKFKPVDWFSITQYYRYLIENEMEYYKYINMHFTDAEVACKKYRTKFSLRARYQITCDRNTDFKNFEHINRNKFEIAHNLHQSPLTPFLGYELFLAVYPENKPYVYKNRFILGTDMRITGNFDFSCAYYYDLSRNTKKAVNNHIIVTRLSYEF